MSGKTVKKIAKSTLLTTLLLVVVLGIHIYIVTKPKADAKTVAMARIDIKQPIDESQAGSIENWVAKQSGVDHVVLNRQTDILVFTFYPVKASADKIAANLRTTFGINAERFVPTEDQLKSSCPAMGSGFTAKLYYFFTHIFNHN